jgi:hypothetical protein
MSPHHRPSDDETRELPALTEKTTISVPAAAAAGGGLAVIAFVFGWLWTLHQRTDQIPLLSQSQCQTEKRLERIESTVNEVRDDEDMAPVPWGDEPNEKPAPTPAAGGN